MNLTGVPLNCQNNYKMAASRNNEKRLECSVCLDFFKKPIRQCVVGHSFCGKCLDPLNVKICPECRSQVTETRNYKLEELLDTIPLPCINKKAGCPFLLDKEEMVDHVFECKYRNLKCEGKKFCDWKCNWDGHDILQHFKDKHNNNANMEYNTSATIPFNGTNKFTDIHIISAHYQLFWYKHKVDVEKKIAYWAFQLIGPRKNASYYFYEFEIYSEEDPIKKFKVTEYCTSDVEDIESVFNSEKCAAISFKMLKNYVNKNNLYSFRFRLMKIPNPEKPKSRSKSVSREPIRHKNKPEVGQPLFHFNPQQFDANGPIWLPIATRPMVPNPVPQPRRYNRK